MGLQAFRENLNKYESEREVIIKDKDILHLEELSSIYEDLLSFDVKYITVELDDKTILNITNPSGILKFIFITEKEVYLIIFRGLQPKYIRST